MGGKLVSVKTYHLAGDDVKIAFSTENPELELIYEDKQGKHKFTGRAIYREKIQLGFMPSVVLDEAPDKYRIILSLAVPSANRSENIKSIPIKTFAVRTKILTSIIGTEAIEGQIQTHDVLLLNGNAW